MNTRTRPNGIDAAGKRLTKERLAVDWDGTCIEELWPATDGAWLEGTIKALRTLYKHYEIVIHTLRVAPVFQDEVTPNPDVEMQAQAIRDRLEEIGLHGIEVWQRPYKPPCFRFIDDRAGFDGNWRRVVRELTARLA